MIISCLIITEGPPAVAAVRPGLRGRENMVGVDMALALYHRNYIIHVLIQ